MLIGSGEELRTELAARDGQLLRLALVSEEEKQKPVDEKTVTLSPCSCSSTTFSSISTTGTAFENLFSETDSEEEKKEEKEAKEPPYTHNNVACDVCSTCPIVGCRFKCLECDDYDLCPACAQVPGGKGRTTGATEGRTRAARHGPPGDGQRAVDSGKDGRSARALLGEEGAASAAEA